MKDVFRMIVFAKSSCWKAEGDDDDEGRKEKCSQKSVHLEPSRPPDVWQSAKPKRHNQDYKTKTKQNTWETFSSSRHHQTSLLSKSCHNHPDRSEIPLPTKPFLKGKASELLCFWLNCLSYPMEWSTQTFEVMDRSKTPPSLYSWRWISS